MEKNIFENLLITTFYIRYNEKKKLLNGKHFVRLFKKWKRCLQARRIPSC